MMDIRLFKAAAAVASEDVLIHTVVDTINAALANNETFDVHVCLKGMSLMDLDKHASFIGTISSCLKEMFPDRLGTCFIYKAPFLFTNLFAVLSKFIDAPTARKIRLVEEPKQKN
jgi:hypothetical protein